MTDDTGNTARNDWAAYLAGEDVTELSVAERAQLDEIRMLLAEPAVWAHPSAGLEDRIVAAITQADDVPEPDGAEVLAAAPAATQMNVVTPLRARVRDAGSPRGRWIRYGLTGVAAAVVAGAGFAIGSIRPAGPVVAFQVALSGTPLSPGATGDATLSKTASGWQIKLQAGTLPRRDNGAYYEAWLKSSTGILVPIGTFNEPTDVTLWAGVPPADFPTLSVTRQSANGNPASSGEVVLSGPVRPAP